MFISLFKKIKKIYAPHWQVEQGSDIWIIVTNGL